MTNELTRSRPLSIERAAAQLIESDRKTFLAMHASADDAVAEANAKREIAWQFHRDRAPTVTP